MPEQTPKTPDRNSADGTGSSRRAQELPQDLLDAIAERERSQRADAAYLLAQAAYRIGQLHRRAQEFYWVVGTEDAHEGLRGVFTTEPAAQAAVAELPGLDLSSIVLNRTYPIAQHKALRAEPAEASVLAALKVLGWPDDRLTPAHPDLFGAGHYWSYVSEVLAAADAADAVDAARERLLSGLQVAEPTNTEETPESALQRFAGELWRLSVGLTDRGIPLRDGPIEGAAVDTALAELDRLRHAVDALCRTAELASVIRDDPQDRSGDGVPETEQAKPCWKCGRTDGDIVDRAGNIGTESPYRFMHAYGQCPEVEQATAVEPLDETCGDCMSGKCHGGEDGECGCARHDASVEASR